MLGMHADTLYLHEVFLSKDYTAVVEMAV